MKRITIYLDKLGMSASFLCAIHCAVLPLLTMLPLIGSFIQLPLEEFLISASVIIASISLGLSYKQHRNYLPLLILITGVNFLLAGMLTEIETIEPILTAFGGLAIFCAHYKNWKLSKQHSIPDAQ